MLGTPSYGAPEQLLGRVDKVGPTTDVYSLGATLYALLVGHPPRLGASLPEILASAPKRPSASRAEVDEKLDRICAIPGALMSSVMPRRNSPARSLW